MQSVIPKDRTRHHIYVGPPAYTVEVMREQLEYLMFHWREACPPDCRDCKRLKELKDVLLKPFV